MFLWVFLQMMEKTCFNVKHYKYNYKDTIYISFDEIGYHKITYCNSNGDTILEQRMCNAYYTTDFVDIDII